MSRVRVRVVCLLLGSACLLATVKAELDTPQNVVVVSLNTNYTLSWEWDQSAAKNHSVTFTTEYIAKYKLKSKRKSPNWLMACEKTSHRSCDLTAFNLYYLGVYVIRVRANLEGNHSEWVLKTFCPDKDAYVGPPSKVALSPAGSCLDIFITDPLTSTNTSMKENLRELYYHIVYWEGIVATQAFRPQTLSTSTNMVTLPELKAWTWYCVTVQSRYDFYNKSSSFTVPHCMQTEGTTPWWKIFLYFMLSLVICFLVMLFSLFGSFWCFKKVKSTFYPSIQLPPQFKEYLCDSPGSDIPRLLSSDSEAELLCDMVTVCPQPPVLEIHDHPNEALEPDSSGRHSRQDSSGSGDSGVYSAGGSSSLQQHSSSQADVPAEASWQGPFDLAQMKMGHIAPGPKGQHLIADEGIVDMCV